MGSEIYLDNSSTTRQYDEVTSLMATIASTKYGNPSSLHTKGIEAERLVSASRETIADLLGVRPSEVYFTSGGTESITWRSLDTLRQTPEKAGTSLPPASNTPLCWKFSAISEAGDGAWIFWMWMKRAGF